MSDLWRLIVAMQEWPDQVQSDFLLEMKLFVDLAKGLNSGESALSELHRAIAHGLQFFTAGGASVSFCDFVYPSTRLSGEIGIADSGGAGFRGFVILPWLPELGGIKVGQLAIDFSIAVRRLLGGARQSVTTVLWVSRSANIETDQGFSSWLIVDYSRGDLESSRDGFKARFDRLLQAHNTEPVISKPMAVAARPAKPVISKPMAVAARPAEPPVVAEDSLAVIAMRLTDISVLLKQIADHQIDSAPPICRSYPIAAYPDFDFESLGMEVVERDGSGAARISYRGNVYTRRSPTNKNYRPTIFYSRALPKSGEDDQTAYEAIIKFVVFSTEVEDLDPRAIKLLN